MNQTDHVSYSPEQQGIESQARLAVSRMIDLAHEATTKLHANGTANDQDMRKVPSFTTPTYSDEGDVRTETGSLEVHCTGSIGNLAAEGVSITRRFASHDIRDKYWIDIAAGKKMLYNVDRDRLLPTNKRHSECSAPETLEIMQELTGVLEPALHPEAVVAKERAATRSQSVTKRNGGFFMRTVRKVFDPSKVFSKKRSS